MSRVVVAAGVLVLAVALALWVASARQTPEPDRDRPAPAAPVAPELAPIAEAARLALAEQGIDARIDVGGSRLTVSWRVRDYLVYRQEEDGRWGTELVEETGPGHEGFLMALTVRPGPFAGQERRPEARPDRYVLGAVRRRPYFNVFPSLTTLDRIDRHLEVDIAVGAGCDMALVRSLHQALLTACADQQWTTPSR